MLKLLEGQPFTIENQKKYQILLIQQKFYFPTNVPAKFQKYYDNPELTMPLEAAKEIFYFQKYEDPAMRGRQSVNPLNKLGFCIAREKEGKIVITELGNRFIAGDYDIGYIFFKSLLKLQFPNPWSDDFSAKYGFDIQPLIAAMHLINKINEKSEKSGLTQTEFSLFVPALINFELIDRYVEKVLKYRRINNKGRFIIEFAKEFYRTKDPTEEQIKNFFEYGDNIMRYFRLTKYFRVTTDEFGGNWRIDLEPIRKTEIYQILKKFSGQSLRFGTKQDYLKYISNIAMPTLPSEDIGNLKEIAKSLINATAQFAEQTKLPLSKEEQNILKTDFSKSTKIQLDDFISSVRTINLKLRERQTKISLLGDVDKIQNIIGHLKNYKTIKKFAPEQFEKIITEALKIINDEIKIKPNYPVDDNGEPISHASGGQPDIECYYKSYNAICEVTLDVSNFQWVRESQPVMRHLRDFETKYAGATNYCLFVAPKIHVDTLYHFWTSIKYGYNGSPQQIIPLTTDQLAILLETLLTLIRQGKKFAHTEIENLYKKIVLKTGVVNGHSEWFAAIPEVIEGWKSKILAQ
ncbi:MAG: AlwI family type II restriction endonuclease [Endomicrobiia bacterium]|nr:AlwI family type II restriction endonuclease [Endomicrobiia bacterium]